MTLKKGAVKSKRMKERYIQREKEGEEKRERNGEKGEGGEEREGDT